jgi:uncharacterized protein (DUF1778 family)
MANQTHSLGRGGRPRKPELERRALQINARVSPDEMAAIEQRAAGANRMLSEFIRELALSGKIAVRQFHALSAIDRHDLARIGNNLNQIARVLNQTGDSARARNIDLLLVELRALLARLDDLGDGMGNGGAGVVKDGAEDSIDNAGNNAVEGSPDELGEGTQD